MSKIVVGLHCISDKAVHDVIYAYYRETEPREIGPPCEAIETCKFYQTQRWRVVGDPDNPIMEVEVRVQWYTTPREFKWGWLAPFCKVVEKDILKYDILTWLSEDDITWELPGVINEYEKAESEDQPRL